VISGKDFRALAAGFGDAAAVSQLIQGQRSLLRALLGAVYQAGITTSAVSAAVKTELRAAWSLLTAIDREQPKALEATLGHPYIRVWAIRCLEQLRPASRWHGDQDQTRDARESAAVLGHLSAIAAAAAVQAGISATSVIPIVDGAAHLPTLGRLAVDSDEAVRRPGQASDTATIQIAADFVSIRIGEGSWTLAIADLLSREDCAVPVAENGRSASWQPVRMLRAPGICVALEDTDPYRDCYPSRAVARLTGSEFARWQQHFQHAWQEIKHRHAAYAPALAAGLTTLVPLDAAQEGGGISAGQAFGAVAMPLPADPVTLALLLIHEFQYVKLAALLDLYDLYDQADGRLFRAPWREDRLPLEGLLQDAYARLAVTDFWRAREQNTADPTAQAAGQRFRQGRAHTRAAIETLASSGSLTPLGESFVDEMRRSARR
jgi:uncharacterized protein